jgi:serine/threonine protein kinase
MASMSILGGRYRLAERLGEGGMSVVWRAHDEVLDRPVAVKLLSTRHATDPRLRRLIRDEARVAARLTHPHICNVYDYGESPGGAGGPAAYIVMELLSGPTMAHELRSGPLPLRDALGVCAQVAGALATAHSNGLVHRDVKPANVMLTPAGAKVVDFGIAAAAGQPSRSDPDGGLWGTPGYVAPERLTGGNVQFASDVYGLGLLLYRALSGGMPWRTETITQMLAAHRYVEPAPLPAIGGLPREVAALVRRCLAKDTGQRPTAYETAWQLAAAGGWRLVSASWGTLVELVDPPDGSSAASPQVAAAPPQVAVQLG